MKYRVATIDGNVRTHGIDDGTLPENQKEAVKLANYLEGNGISFIRISSTIYMFCNIISIDVLEE